MPPSTTLRLRVSLLSFLLLVYGVLGAPLPRCSQGLACNVAFAQDEWDGGTNVLQRRGDGIWSKTKEKAHFFGSVIANPRPSDATIMALTHDKPPHATPPHTTPPKRPAKLQKPNPAEKPKPASSSSSWKPWSKKPKEPEKVASPPTTTSGAAQQSNQSKWKFWSKKPQEAPKHPKLEIYVEKTVTQTYESGAINPLKADSHLSNHIAAQQHHGQSVPALVHVPAPAKVAPKVKPHTAPAIVGPVPKDQREAFPWEIDGAHPSLSTGKGKGHRNP